MFLVETRWTCEHGLVSPTLVSIKEVIITSTFLREQLCPVEPGLGHVHTHTHTNTVTDLTIKPSSTFSLWLKSTSLLAGRKTKFNVLLMTYGSKTKNKSLLVKR